MSKVLRLSGGIQASKQLLVSGVANLKLWWAASSSFFVRAPSELFFYFSLDTSNGGTDWLWVEKERKERKGEKGKGRKKHVNTKITKHNRYHDVCAATFHFSER